MVKRWSVKDKSKSFILDSIDFSLWRNIKSEGVAVMLIRGLFHTFAAADLKARLPMTRPIVRFLIKITVYLVSWSYFVR